MRRLTNLHTCCFMLLSMVANGLLTEDTTNEEMITAYRKPGETDTFLLPSRLNCSQIDGASASSIQEGKLGVKNTTDSQWKSCSCSDPLRSILHFGIVRRQRKVFAGCFHHEQICRGNN